jgi:hypothetical protein
VETGKVGLLFPYPLSGLKRLALAPVVKLSAPASHIPQYYFLRSSGNMQNTITTVDSQH